MHLLGVLFFTCLSSTKAIIQAYQESIVFEYAFDSTLSDKDQSTCYGLLDQTVDLEIKIRGTKFTGSFYYSATPQQVETTAASVVDFAELKQTSIATYTIYFEQSDNSLSSAVEKLVYRQFNHAACIYNYRIEYNTAQIVIFGSFNFRCLLESDGDVVMRLRVNSFEHSITGSLHDLALMDRIELNCSALDQGTGKTTCSDTLQQISADSVVNASVETILTQTFSKVLYVADETNQTDSPITLNLAIQLPVKYPISARYSLSVDCFARTKLITTEGVLEIMAEKGVQLLCNNDFYEQIGGDGAVVLYIIVSERRDYTGRIVFFEQELESFDFEQLDYFISCQADIIVNMTRQQCSDNITELLSFYSNSSVQIGVKYFKSTKELAGSLRFSAELELQWETSAKLQLRAYSILVQTASKSGILQYYYQTNENMELFICKSQSAYLDSDCVFQSSIVVNYPSEDGKYLFPVTKAQENTILRVTAGPWLGFLESRQMSVVISECEIAIYRPEMWQAYLVLIFVLLALVIFYIVDAVCKPKAESASQPRDEYLKPLE